MIINKLPFARYIEKPTGNGIVSGLFSLGGTLLTNRAQKKSQERQFNYNKQLQEQQFQNQLALNNDSYKKQVDFWDMQNEYNTPANQRKLLQEGGFNVLDAVRNGGAITDAGQLSPVSAGTAGGASVGSYNSADFAQSFAQVAGGLSSLSDAQLKEQQASTEAFKQKLMSEQTLLTSAQVVGQNTANSIASINELVAQNSAEYDIEARKQNVLNMKASFDACTADILLKMNEYGRESLVRQKLAQEIGVMQGTIMLQQWQTAMIQSDIRVNEAEIQSLYAQATELYSRSDWNTTRSNTESWKLNGGYYEAEKLVNRAVASKTERERKWMPVMNVSKIINDRTDDFKNLGAGLAFSSQALSSFVGCLEKAIFMRFGRSGVKTFNKANKYGEFIGGTSEHWSEKLGH